VSLRLREEVQAVLRRGDGELNLLWLPSCLGIAHSLQTMSMSTASSPSTSESSAAISR
jgi:hypothetical protein